VLNDDLLLQAYRESTTAIAYWLSRSIARAFPDHAIIETDDHDFDVDVFLSRETCEVVLHPSPHPVVDAAWFGPEKGRRQVYVQGHRTVTWQGTAFEVIDAAWPQGFGMVKRRFFVGPTRADVEAFVDHVAKVAGVTDDEVMVFASGCWRRSKELRDAIRSATFDNLILPGDLGRELLASCRHFLASRQEYARFGVPWKRGVLMLGPPGNGKTHCIKALLNALRIPCLYVQSFESNYGTPQQSVQRVFERARRTTPCALVLEDLDSLLTDKTRSFFLNELDGFAANHGILTIASTNHPERLDPAIRDRPSRFDRKVTFGMPGVPERLRYLQMLNRKMGEELTDDTLADLAQKTTRFSFAYVKELMVSAVTTWLAEGRSRPLEAIARETLRALREQLPARGDAADDER